MEKIKDLKIRKGVKASELATLLGTTGFQASHIRDAAQLIKKMRSKECTVFLSFTANMMASGLRGLLTQLVEEGYVDAVITTGGSIDHDIIRSEKPYILGDFQTDDIDLHQRGVNRIGNVLVPNNRYMYLEKQMRKHYKSAYKEGKQFTPSELNKYLGSRLPKESFLATCERKKVPVYCPGMIDSAAGMHLYFFRQDHKDFNINTAADLENLAQQVFTAKKTAGIILGGGISKHHLIGANLMRGGLDYAVYVSTATEYDGSLSGAKPQEAKSWGKIAENGRMASVYADATLALPLIMASLIT